MCRRRLAEIRASTWLGIGSVAAISVAMALALVPIGLRIGGPDSAGHTAFFSPYLLRVVGFTILQASLSTLLSVGLGVAASLSLAGAGSFAGRRLVVGLLALPLSVPALVAIFGIVAIFGENGVISRIVSLAGIAGPGTIYGLAGILLTHVFFNLPLTARLVTAGLDAMPAETHRLADMLAMPPLARFRLVEWPVIRAVLPAAASLVFLLCLTSFAVTLTLGGGPRATTIEVALYQALRFDLDFALAVKLAAVEMAIAAVALVALSLSGQPLPMGETLASGRRPYPLATRWVSRLLLVAVIGFVAAPLLAVVAAGLSALSTSMLADAAIWRALATSLAVAVAAAIAALAVGGGLAAALAAHSPPPIATPLFAAFGSLTLVLPPMLLGAGWFLLLLPGGDPARYAAVVVIIANALMAVPYVVRTMRAPIARSREQHDHLASSLGIGRFDRLRLIDGPMLARPLAAAALFAMLVSLGDFGAIALFGNEEFVTLPTLLYQRLGNYRSDDAAAIALILLAAAAALTAAASRLDREAF